MRVEVGSKIKKGAGSMALVEFILGIIGGIIGLAVGLVGAVIGLVVGGVGLAIALVVIALVGVFVVAPLVILFGLVF
jgi:hypothetical protein